MNDELNCEDNSQKIEPKKSYFRIYIYVILGLSIICNAFFVLSDEYKKTKYKTYTTDPKKIEQLISTLQPLLDPIFVKIYAEKIMLYSEKNGFKPELITCFIARASGFNQIAETKYPTGKKLVGLMQVDSENTKTYIDENIENGCKAFKEILIKNSGDVVVSLNEYFQGNTTISTDILKMFTESTILYNIDKSSTEKVEK